MLRVGGANDIAENGMQVFDVDGTRVGVANASGRLYAFDNKCTHMGCSLAEGTLDGITVTCPCHGSQFDVTAGAVVRGPAQRPVRSRAIQVDGDDLLLES